MPLGQFEREVLRLLAANRNPDSFVAGATVLNRDPASLRTSKDVAVVYPRETFQRATVEREGQRTKMEWALDSAFRFFPVEPDDELGWRLNFWDAAINKVLAFAGRSEVRDLVDVLELHQRHLHLGALAWAGAGKDPGMTPESIIQWGSRNAIYRPEELADLSLSRPITLPELKDQWLRASHDAIELITQLPVTEVGCLYLDAAGKPTCPTPQAAGFSGLHRHYGSIKGAWPRITR